MTTTEQIVKRTLESEEESRRLIDLFEKHESNSDWIVKNLKTLKEQYANKYVAIRKGNVIESDKNLMRLIEKLTRMNIELGDITIRYVTERPIKFLL